MADRPAQRSQNGPIRIRDGAGLHHRRSGHCTPPARTRRHRDRLASRRQPLRLSIAYLAWHADVFVWMVLFWCWEFRFTEFVEQWTVGLYFFLIVYAVTLFLMSAVMVPRTWDPVDDLGVYFLERKAWFYSLQLLANGLDITDSYLKGQGLAQQPVLTLVLWALIVVACVVGLRTTKLRLHAVMAVSILAFQVISAFGVLPRLA